MQASNCPKCGLHADDTSILSNVLLKAEGDSLSLTATDLDVTISNAVEAKVEQPDIHLLVKTGQHSGVKWGQPDRVGSKANQCTIQCGSSFYKVNGLEAEELRPMPAFRADQPEEDQPMLVRCPRHLICGVHRRE